jgi:hypothetical protein
LMISCASLTVCVCLWATVYVRAYTHTLSLTSYF